MTPNPLAVDPLGEGLDALAPLPPPAGTDPKAVARAITERSRTSFGPAMRLLPRARREGMWALYAFCRILDDIADEDWPLPEKRRLLEGWRAEIGRVFQGDPRSAVGRALAEPVRVFGPPRREFLALIDGMRMDADGPIVAPDMETLRLYARRVAGAVGAISMRIFGAWRGPESERFALALGEALQLVNILRDIGEDARLGRLYLPRETLARHGLPVRPRESGTEGIALEEIVLHPALPAAAAEIGGLARAGFARARAEIPAHSRRALAPALMMMGVYEGVLDRMEAAGFRPGAATPLTRKQKVWRGLRAVLRPGTSPVMPPATPPAGKNHA